MGEIITNYNILDKTVFVAYKGVSPSSMFIRAILDDFLVRGNQLASLAALLPEHIWLALHTVADENVTKASPCEHPHVNKANLGDLIAVTSLAILHKLDSNHRFFNAYAFQFNGWPWKTIGHLIFAMPNSVHYFKAISEFKMELQSGNAQFG